VSTGSHSKGRSFNLLQIACCLKKDVEVGTEEEVVGRGLVMNGAVDILYNTIIVNRDQERGWVGASVVGVLLEKFLHPATKPS
jgi:hypothetical protein